MRTINSIEAYAQHKALEIFFMHSDFKNNIDRQIANMSELLAKCPEQWIAKNIQRSIDNLIGVKKDIELAYKRSVEINNTPFLDGVMSYYLKN